MNKYLVSSYIDPSEIRTFHNFILSSKPDGSHEENRRLTYNTCATKQNTSLGITSTEILHQFSLHSSQLLVENRTTGTHVILHTCPFCTKPTHGKQDNLFKLYVKIGEGAYFCHRCGSKGSWGDFKRRLRGKKDLKNNIKESYIMLKHKQQSFESNLFNNDKILKYLINNKSLSYDTLKKYGVGLVTNNNKQFITFPWSTNNNNPFTPCQIKAYHLNSPYQSFYDPPDKKKCGIFGYHTIPSDYTDLIVLTLDEIDAMSIYQATRKHALSLRSGQSTLPIDVLTLLERFKSIILWLPEKYCLEFQKSEIIARKLGIHRTRLVKSSLTANIALLKNINLLDILNQSSPINHEAIETFNSLRVRVLNEIRNPKMYSGVPVKSLPKLTKILKGFRKGELTVLTGRTGIGKTTLLGQLSIDIAEQGIKTLWGSFEIKNTRLLQKLLHQYARYPLPTINDSKSNISKLEQLSYQFENLPLHFLKFHGSSDMDDVIDAMEYASYVHEVEHVILDNMQFMLSASKQRDLSNKFYLQDNAISTLRKFATRQHVHITLVIHPRKENEETKLGISSIFGGVKATQEADAVLILQYDGRKKWIDVKKNRFDGTLGSCPLIFSAKTGRYTDGSEIEVL